MSRNRAIHIRADVTAKICDEMKERGIGTRQLAEKLGWDYMHLWRILRNYAPLYVDELTEISSALELGIENWLL